MLPLSSVHHVIILSPSRRRATRAPGAPASDAPAARALSFRRAAASQEFESKSPEYKTCPFAATSRARRAKRSAPPKSTSRYGAPNWKPASPP
eukprot:scaffold225506_cov30-Tisochrysis_lutea.AAC.2